MKYQKVVSGVFLRRPNRFIADVLVDGREERVHVKNTGRCRELLLSGAAVILEDMRNGRQERKTAFDLIAVKKKGDGGETWVNMDSQAPNRVAEEALRAGRLGVLLEGASPALIRREVTYGNSRFDLYAEADGRKTMIEVKGVTLECGGTAMFPDAPTQRGVKHIRELIRAREAGYEAAVLFVIQMERVQRFRPNFATHPEFGRALREAREAGVGIFAYSCRVEPDSLTLNRPVPVEL